MECPLNLSGSEFCGVVALCNHQHKFCGTSIAGLWFSGRPNVRFTTASCRVCLCVSAVRSV